MFNVYVRRIVIVILSFSLVFIGRCVLLSTRRRTLLHVKSMNNKKCNRYGREVELLSSTTRHSKFTYVRKDEASINIGTDGQLFSIEKDLSRFQPLCDIWRKYVFCSILLAHWYIDIHCFRLRCVNHDKNHIAARLGTEGVDEDRISARLLAASECLVRR